VERLRNLLDLEGCANLEPEHRVAATISRDTLQRGLAHTGIRQENLFDQVNPSRMVFKDDASLVCAYGKHRLKAGESFKEYEWLVELYSSSKCTLEMKRQCQQFFKIYLLMHWPNFMRNPLTRKISKMVNIQNPAKLSVF